MLRGIKTSNYILQSIRWNSTNGPVAPFATPDYQGRKHVTFDKNMPSYTKPKAWERDGQDKEKWFKRKHAHHHILQKPQRENTQRRYDGIKRKNHEERMEKVREMEKIREHRTRLRQIGSNPNIDMLFGTNAVLAALKGDKRKKFGKLYIHNPKDSEKVNEILHLANEKNVKITETSKQDINQLTDNAVHNGIALETKPLEITEIKSMSCKFDEDSFNINIRNEISNKSEDKEIPLDTFGKRYPFGIYLDEISDPHNVGAILRSAYFLGADFIVFSERNCAPLTPVVAKSSSGAIEFLNLFKVDKPLTFFEESKDNGWSLISTVASTGKNKKKSSLIDANTINEMLQTQPVILVIGSEGAGIRTNLINRSDYLVSIESGREMNECVDSLNVSVATALLISKILK